MSTNIPPQTARPDPINQEMLKLSDDSAVVRSAHFIAAQRKGRNQTIIGLCIVVINVLIGSNLIETITTSGKAAFIIKLLAFLAASLAGIQTFFNFQKQVECHTTSGDKYSSIFRRLGLLIAEYQSEIRGRAEILADYKLMRDEYLKANDDSRPCVPSDSDLRNARANRVKDEITS